MEEESQYHFINCLSLIDQVRRDQVAQEQRYLAGDEKFSSEHKSYKDLYDRVIGEQETLSKNLRGEQKNIKETHESDVGQRQMFLNLRRLLQCKLKTNKELKVSTSYIHAWVHHSLHYEHVSLVFVDWLIICGTGA
jgi:hypothetical protein